LEETSEGHLAQAEPSRAGCPGSCPEDFWISPRMEIAHSPWASYASAWLPSQ